MYYDYVEEFITKLVLNTANKRKGLKQYQDKCRIYLDEYPEQKELRKNFFGKNHDMFKHIYTRFLRRN